MKAIIDGKRYDTDTAEELAGWENMADRGNFRYESFDVYRTKKGRYFLCYSGGPLSSYARRAGNEYHGSNGIKPLTEAEAIEYLEGCGREGTAAIEKYFTIEEA
jgi:hypothetical protein